MGYDPRDEQADVAIRSMIAAVIGTAVVPAHVNWALTATAMGGGVVAIGAIYGVQLTRDEAWKLVQQFFVAAGAWFLAMNVGSKVLAAIIQSTGIGYAPAVAMDAAVSAAAAFAIGEAAKEYFKGQKDMGKIGKIFRDSFTNYKNKNKRP